MIMPFDDPARQAAKVVVKEQSFSGSIWNKRRVIFRVNCPCSKVLAVFCVNLAFSLCSISNEIDRIAVRIIQYLVTGLAGQFMREGFVSIDP